MTDIKDDIQQRFGSEEAIGVYYGVYETGQTVEQFHADHPGEHVGEDDLSALLPNGRPMSICTENAHHIKDCLGEGLVFGFDVRDNPQAQSDCIQMAGGHDFLIYKDRYLIDTWLSVFTFEEPDQCVFDLADPDDAEKVRYYYGDHANWSFYNENENRFIPKGEKGFAHNTFERIDRLVTSHFPDEVKHRGQSHEQSLSV